MSNPYAPSEAEPIPASDSTAYLPIRMRALVLQRALQASILFEGLLLATSWAESSFGEPDSGLALTLLLFVFLAALGQSLAYFVAVVAWLTWEYRAYKNLPALGAVGLQHTPGSTIVWWFVPFANLVRPLQVMTELWEASAAQAKDQQGPDVLITAWWIAWVVSNVSSNLVLRIYGFEDSPEADLASMVVAALGLVASVLALNVVRSIDEVQAAAARERGFAH